MKKKLEFEKEKWYFQLAMDFQKWKDESLTHQKKLDAKWQLKKAELQFQKREKEKDWQEEQFEKERESLAMV